MALICPGREGGSVGHIDVFLRMNEAYKQELGEAFPLADPRSVLLVLQECYGPEGTTQKQIEQATKISQSNVAKLVAKMEQLGWLYVLVRDPKNSMKTIRIADTGQFILMRLETDLGLAARNIHQKAKRQISAVSPVFNLQQSIDKI